MTGLTTGLDAVDALIDGVRIGDNLVVQTPIAEVAELVMRRFVEAADRPLVVCTTPTSPVTDLPDGVQSIDLDTDGSDGLARLKERIAEADELAGGEALFVFWSLSELQSTLGEAGALELFVWACPRLYRRGSIALWPMDATHHRPSFLRRLHEITQVIVEVTAGEDPGELMLEVTKADGRPTTTTGRRVRVDRETMTTLGPADSQRDPLGMIIRRERISQNVGQGDLAARVGVSASALSQLERGARSVSADTLTRIWEALGVPFGPDDGAPDRYRISRRGGRPRAESARGVTRQLLASDSDIGQLWRVTLAPGSSGRGAPFPVKSAEMISVVAGIVDLEMGGLPETLLEGDSLTTSTTAITAWANPSTGVSELLWFIVAAP